MARVSAPLARVVVGFRPVLDFVLFDVLRWQPCDLFRRPVVALGQD
jgi:hypothetical protein